MASLGLTTNPGEYKVSDPRFDDQAFGGLMSVYRSVDDPRYWKTGWGDTLFSLKRDAVAYLDAEFEHAFT